MISNDRTMCGIKLREKKREEKEEPEEQEGLDESVEL